MAAPPPLRGASVRAAPALCRKHLRGNDKAQSVLVEAPAPLAPSGSALLTPESDKETNDFPRVCVLGKRLLS